MSLRLTRSPIGCPAALLGRWRLIISLPHTTYYVGGETWREAWEKYERIGQR